MQFRKKLFGYSPAEVQEALEQLEKEKSKITADYEAIVLQVQEQLKAGKTENERLKTELIKAREQQNRYEKDLEEERERLAEAYGEADQLKKKYENKSLLLSKGMVEMQDQKAQILRKAEEQAQQQMRDTHQKAEALLQETRSQTVQLLLEREGKIKALEDTEHTIREETVRYASQSGTAVREVYARLETVIDELKGLEQKLEACGRESNTEPEPAGKDVTVGRICQTKIS